MVFTGLNIYTFMRFKEWLLKEAAGQPGAKQALYPMGYGGIGLYPPSDVITWAADAVTYMPTNMRQLTFVWGDGMLGDPFASDDLYKHIEGKVAKQVQAGSLKLNNKAFAKEDSKFGKSYASIDTVQIGGLDVKGIAFEKVPYVRKTKRGGGLWDYKQIGQFNAKPMLSVSSTL